MECKELAFFRSSPKELKPSPEILLHLLEVRKIVCTEITYPSKVKLMDCKEMSV